MKKIIVRCPSCNSDKIYDRVSVKEFWRVDCLVDGMAQYRDEHIEGEAMIDDVFYCDECDTLFDIPVTEEVEVDAGLPDCCGYRRLPGGRA